MDCSVCGSQDTTPKSGISKKTGKPYKGYVCNEPTCVNDKGYPNMTFAPTPRGPQIAPKVGKTAPVVSGGALNSLEVKVNKILAILQANFPEPEIAIKEDEGTPF